MDPWLELGAAGVLFAVALVVGLLLAFLRERGLYQTLEARTARQRRHNGPGRRITSALR